ncbi:MAG: BlaI/MecI/CopY family transcriptional regulator [Candidatus Aminicenantes bacterium]|nr:BlaI/MecI/CopY family transcriptional regulator [Candidatus Aminicenantes bacterium]
MKELTKAEEQIMQVLWRLEKGFVKDVIDRLPDPKPAYNTVSTIVRILEKKGFVAHNAYGNTHEYFPTVSKDDYKKRFLKSFIKRYFGNSFQEMVSFFASDRDITLGEMEEIRELLNEEIQKHKGKKND